MSEQILIFIWKGSGKSYTDENPSTRASHAGRRKRNRFVRGTGWDLCCLFNLCVSQRSACPKTWFCFYNTSIVLKMYPEESLLEQIDALNANEFVHGILIQLPLPGHMNEQRVLDRLDPRKDVDGFHPINLDCCHRGEVH